MYVFTGVEQHSEIIDSTLVNQVSAKFIRTFNLKLHIREFSIA